MTSTFILRNGDVLANLVKAIFGLVVNEDKPQWQVTIQPYKSKRTNAQNALYWKWMAIIADFTGDTKDAMHKTFVKKFLNPVELEIFGESVTLDVETKKLEPSVFSEYMRQVESFAWHDLGVVLPHPEDRY